MDCFDWGFLGGASNKTPPASSGDSGDARDTDSVSGLGRSPVVRNDNLLKYSFLKNSLDRGA